MRFLTASLLGAALALSACASPGVRGGGFDHPTGPGDLILRIDLTGGFLPPLTRLRQGPIFALYGDGRLIVPGPQIEIYPGPALPNLQVRTISEEGIQAILAAARRAGLVGPDRHYLQQRIADASTTTFTVVADGVRHVVSAYALGEPTDGLPSDEAAAREQLSSFLSKVTDLPNWLPAGSLGAEGPYSPTGLRLYVLPYQPSDLHEPAEDWPLGSFAGFQPTSGFGDVRCGGVSGADARAAMAAAAEANELTPWRADGRVWSVVFRPLLPDESCR